MKRFNVMRSRDQTVTSTCTPPLQQSKSSQSLLAGHAFAGGGILSLVHDYRLMRTKKGFWCMNEVHLGMFLREGMLVIVRYIQADRNGK